jgi:hypothetical protein
MATAKNSPAGTVRVVNVSSLSHNRGAPEGIRWPTVSPDGNDALEARKKLGTIRLYGQSKLVMKMHSQSVLMHRLMNPLFR